MACHLVPGSTRYSYIGPRSTEPGMSIVGTPKIMAHYLVLKLYYTRYQVVGLGPRPIPRESQAKNKNSLLIIVFFLLLSHDGDCLVADLLIVSLPLCFPCSAWHKMVAKLIDCCFCSMWVNLFLLCLILLGLIVDCSFSTVQCPQLLQHKVNWSCKSWKSKFVINNILPCAKMACHLGHYGISRLTLMMVACTNLGTCMAKHAAACLVPMKLGMQWWTGWGDCTKILFFQQIPNAFPNGPFPGSM